MKTVTEMLKEVENLDKQLADMKTRCIQENREPSAEERRIANTVLDRIDELEELITLEQRHAETHNRLEKSQRRPLKPDPMGGSDPDRRKQEEKDKFGTFGQQLVAVIRAASPDRMVDPRLRTSLFDAASGLSESVASDGGFLVQQEFVADLLRRTYETGQVASRCKRIPIGVGKNGLKINAVDETSRATGSRFGGIRGYWEGEADEKTKSKPKFRIMELSLRKLIGLCYSTDELLEDAVALEGIIREGFGAEFGFLLDEACVHGTGVNQPLGIMASPCLVTVNKETGQLAKTVVYENICNMWARLWSRSMLNAVWFINQDVMPQLFTMGITIGVGGSPVFLPPGGASGSPYASLFGRPVVPIEHCQTLGTVGDIILADYGEYLLIDKGPMQAATSIHVRFVYDETAFRFVYRVDGQPIWNAALTPARGSNTLSPFVVLQARA
jgi:HK97 family phage major capsid protein